MFGKIRNVLLFKEFSPAQLKAVIPLISEENRKFCIIWSVVNDLFWTYCLIMSTMDPLYRTCREIYAAAFFVATVTLVLSVRVAPKHSRIIRPVAAILDEVLLLTGILIARHLAPRTIMVFASVLIVPVAFIANSFSTILLLLFNILIFMLIGSRTMDSETYQWVLSNLCIFSVLGMMIGHFVNKARFERFIFAESNAELAEIQTRNARYDQLTDLQNRRAYAEKLDQLSREQPAGCQVVIADINGLKETNDTAGHDAGDELVIGAAECLRQSFNGVDMIYRIGGDEFCVIIPDASYDVEQALDQLKKLSAAWKGRFNHGISISAGTASTEEFGDIESAVKAADQRMFVFKRSYYESFGRDRRRRQTD